MEKNSPLSFLARPLLLSNALSSPEDRMALQPFQPGKNNFIHDTKSPSPGLCQAILRDGRYYFFSENEDIDYLALFEEIRRALGAQPLFQDVKDKKPALQIVEKLFDDEAGATRTGEQLREKADADSAILAQALSFACSPLRFGTTGTKYSEAQELLQRLSKTDLLAAIQRESFGKKAEEKPLWRAVFFLASSNSGMNVLRKICPWPEETPDRLAIFLGAGARLMLSRPDTMPSNLADLLHQFPESAQCNSPPVDAAFGRDCRAMHAAYKTLVHHVVDDSDWINLLKVHNGLDCRQEKFVDRIFRKLSVWCDRSLTREPFATKLFDATLRKAFAPYTKKKMFDALTDILASDVSKPGALSASRLRLMAEILRDRLREIEAPYPRREAVSRLLCGLHEDDPELTHCIRRRVLDQVLKRRYAVLDGTYLNEREIQEILNEIDKSWMTQLSEEDFRYGSPTSAELTTWRKQLVDLIRSHSGPLDVQQLQIWADRLRNDFPCHCWSVALRPEDQSLIDANECLYPAKLWRYDPLCLTDLLVLKEQAKDTALLCSPVGGQKASGSDKPEKLLPNFPTRQDLADVLTDLTRRLDRGGSYRISSNGTFRFSIAPVTELASGAFTGGLVSVTLDAGFVTGKEVVWSVEHAPHSLELFIGRDRMLQVPIAVEASSGASTCFLFQASAGVRVSAAYGRREREGILVRLPLSTDPAIREDERHEFAELVGKLVMHQDPSKSIFDGILRDHPGVTISKIGGKTNSIGGSVKISATANLAGKLLEAGVGAHLQGDTKSTVTCTRGRHTQVSVSHVRRSELGIKGALSGMAVEHGRRLLGKQLETRKVISLQKKVQIGEEPYENFEITEMGGSPTQIVYKKIYKNRDAFIKASHKDLPPAFQKNDSTHFLGKKAHFSKTQEIEQFFHEVESENSDFLYEINKELKPHALHMLNRYRAISANTLMISGAVDSTTINRVVAMLNCRDSWRMNSIARINVRKKDKRAGINLLSFFYGERKKAFMQRFSDTVSIPGSNEHLIYSD